MRSMAYKNPHKNDPGKQDDEDLLEKMRLVFADPVPSMEVPGFGRRLADIIQSGLRAAADRLPGKKQHRETRQSRPLRLTLHRTNLSPSYRSELHFEVIEDGRAVGRIYEDLQAPPELRWYWSITAPVGDSPDVVTNGRAPTLDLAKARFLKNWQKCRSAAAIAVQADRNHAVPG
jgi:hypothetical protein